MSATVAIVSSRAEAELIVGMLRNHGINARISADDLGGVDMALQAQGVRVMVPDQELDEANQLLGRSDKVFSPTKPLNAFQKWVGRILGGNA